MEENKYYTPDITELYVGYECKHTSNMSAFIWSEKEGGLQKFLRTKYLDRSDIERCGWTHVGGQNYEMIIPSTIEKQPADKWELTHYDKIVCINSEYSNRCFDGECKSINELRTIMKFLKITQDGTKKESNSGN